MARHIGRQATLALEWWADNTDDRGVAFHAVANGLRADFTTVRRALAHAGVPILPDPHDRLGRVPLDAAHRLFRLTFGVAVDEVMARHAAHLPTVVPLLQTAP